MTAEILKAEESDTYQRAAAAIAAGSLVAFPTETVYGLGADATNAQAVARIFEAKGRPQFNPLIVHVGTLEEARKLAEFSDAATRLAEAFWPGGLTLVLPRKPDCRIADLVTAGLDTIAIRVPAGPVARDFLRAVEGPVAAPSANVSGRVSPTDAAHVIDDLSEKIDLIIDGGTTETGVESTILAVQGEVVHLLRPGAATLEDIETVLGHAVEKATEDGARPSAPGQLKSHYAPSIPVRLNAHKVAPDEALLAFGAPVDGAAATLNLSAEENVAEAAANLFSMLRALDDPRFKAIAVMPVPQYGLGLAVNDRLERAATRPEDGATA